MDKCISLGLCVVKLGTRYTFKFYVNIYFSELCAENSVVGLGTLPYLVLIEFSFKHDIVLIA